MTTRISLTLAKRAVIDRAYRSAAEGVVRQALFFRLWRIDAPFEDRKGRLPQRLP